MAARLVLTARAAWMGRERAFAGVRRGSRSVGTDRFRRRLGPSAVGRGGVVAVLSLRLES